MALALNVFRTYTAAVTTSLTAIYTVPAGYTGIGLMIQVSNITTTSGQATVIYSKGGVDTELIKDYSIPGNDAASALTGRLVMETGGSIKVSANANGKFKITLSVLETANE